MTRNESLSIRAADSPALFDAFAAMMADSPPWNTLGMDVTACRSGFDGPSKTVFVATLDDAPVGFAIVQSGGSFNGYIQTLFVTARFQGRGLGKKLLDYCESFIHRSSPNVFICVSSFNLRALQLYQAVGFTLIGALKDFLVPGADELLLRKTLGPRIGYTPPNQ